MAGFAESIGKWASQTEERISAVHRTALEGLAIEMTRTKAEGGAVPVDTGNLYRSLVASTSGLPAVSDDRATGSNATAVIATLRPTQSLYLGYTADYARRMNYGFVGEDALGRSYNQDGNHFVERAIAMWPKIVMDAVNKVRTNANS